jgi:sugar-specific transcriptional regulator TrmB
MDRRTPEDLLNQVSERIDLTDYEVEAYLTVLDHGDVTATELATVTDIPQSRIYDVLRSLNERGLIDIHETRPMKAIALDPKNIFNETLESLSTLSAELRHQYTVPDRSEEAAYLIKSKPSLERRIRKIMEGAEFELIASLPPSVLETFHEGLGNAQDRTVTTELVLSPTVDAPSKEKYRYELIADTVRAREGKRTPIIVIADGANAIFTSRSALTDDGNERYGVVFNSSDLGALAYSFFETMIWPTSGTVLHESSCNINEPRVFASVRRCIEQINQYGEEINLHVEGMYVETNEPAEVEGIVCNTELSDDLSIATIEIEDSHGRIISIGGRAAALEDIEASQLTISATE